MILDEILISHRYPLIKNGLDFEGESCFMKEKEKVEDNHIE